MKEDLILIGGKAYRKAKVIMLPTDRESEIYLYNGRIRASEYTGAVKQHLYFISDEEIKEGDWIYDNNKKQIIGCGAMGSSANLKRDFPFYYKIIATTDKSLTIFKENKLWGQKNTGVYSESPRPSDDFLKAYCKANGKIDEVLVEYEIIKGQFYHENCDDIDCGCKEYKLKVAPDNTITIKKVELDIERAILEYSTKVNNHFSNEEDRIRVNSIVRAAFKAGVEWYKNNINYEAF